MISTLQSAVLPWQLPFVTYFWDARVGVAQNDAAGRVSAWTDRIVGTNLSQSNTTNQPSWDGSVITFDGISQFLASGAIATTQPDTIVVLVKQVTYTADHYIVDMTHPGGSGATQVILQKTAGTQPTITMYAGTQGADNNDLALGTFGIVTATFNGASSSLQVNLNTATTVNAGANNGDGIALAANAATGGNAGNIAVKAFAVCNSALSAAQLFQLQTAINQQFPTF